VAEYARSSRRRCRRRGRRVVDERALQLVGNDAEIVVVHVDEGVNPGFDADVIGRRDEVAVSDEAHLVGAGDDPLRVGCGEMGGKQEHTGTEMRGVDHLACGVLRAELDGMRALTQLGDPFGMAGQQAPVVADANGVDGVKVRAGLGACIDEAVLPSRRGRRLW